VESKGAVRGQEGGGWGQGSGGRVQWGEVRERREQRRAQERRGRGGKWGGREGGDEHGWSGGCTSSGSPGATGRRPQGQVASRTSQAPVTRHTSLGLLAPAWVGHLGACGQEERGRGRQERGGRGEEEVGRGSDEASLCSHEQGAPCATVHLCIWVRAPAQAQGRQLLGAEGGAEAWLGV